MRLRYHPRIASQLADAPPVVRRAFDRKVELLAQNFQHPSLRAKKYDEANDIWQGRISREWRFYFFKSRAIPTQSCQSYRTRNSVQARERGGVFLGDSFRTLEIKNGMCDFTE